MHRSLPLESSTRFPCEKFDTGEMTNYKDAYYMCKTIGAKTSCKCTCIGNMYVVRQAWNFFIEHVKRKGTDA